MSKEKEDRITGGAIIYGLFFLAFLRLRDGNNDGLVLIATFILATVFIYLIDKFRNH